MDDIEIIDISKNQKKSNGDAVINHLEKLIDELKKGEYVGGIFLCCGIRSFARDGDCVTVDSSMRGLSYGITVDVLEKSSIQIIKQLAKMNSGVRDKLNESVGEE